MIIFVWLLLTAAMYALSGWAFMIAVGIAHAEWVPSLPTIGFWPALAIASLLTIALRVGGTSRSSNN